MTDIEQKALALVRKEGRGYLNYDAVLAALCRALEQHEAFRQEVSDAVSQYADEFVPADLQRFINAAPKPDPLVEAMHDCGVDRFESWADQLRAALDARGLEIREKNDD